MMLGPDFRDFRTWAWGLQSDCRRLEGLHRTGGPRRRERAHGGRERLGLGGWAEIRQ